MATAINSFWNRMAAKVPGCPVPAAHRAIVDAVRQFCEDTHVLLKSFEEEDIDYTTIDSTDNDSITITLTSYFTGYEPIVPEFFQIDGGNWNLSRLDLYNDNSNLDSIQLTDTKFYNFPSTTTMKIFPFTDQGANFDIFLKLAVKPNDGSTTFDDFLFNDWRKAIVPLAVAMLQEMPDRPWSNPNMAAYNRQQYLINSGKAKLNKSMGHTSGSSYITGGYF
jgi:hypothetical protein